MRTPTIWFPNRSDTNQAVQAKEMARGWKFWFQKVQELYYPCSKNKGADQPVTVKLICAFVFAYAKCWFSHYMAHRVLELIRTYFFNVGSL